MSESVIRDEPLTVLYDGQEHALDIDNMDLPDAMHIKRKTGLGLLDLYEGLTRLEPDALRALYWLMMKQGPSGKVYDMDRLNFKPIVFGYAVIKAMGADEDAEAEEDPKETPPE